MLQKCVACRQQCGRKCGNLMHTEMVKMITPKEKDFQGALPDVGMVTAVYYNHYS